MSPHRVGGNVVPYLTHEVNHHGQMTPTPPDNTGRMRQAPIRQNGNSKEGRSRLRQGRETRTEEGPRFNVGPRSFRGITFNRAGRRGGRADRHTIEPFVEEAYPDYPPPTFQEAMAETASISSTNMMPSVAPSLSLPEPELNSSVVRGTAVPQANDTSFCSSVSPQALTPKESDAESMSSLEIIEPDSIQELDRSYSEERRCNCGEGTQVEFPTSGTNKDRGRQGIRKVEQDSDEDETLPPSQPQSPTKRRNLSLSPLRTLFPYRNAEPHRVHSALPAPNNSPYSHHTPFMSATSLPMKMSMSTTSFANSLKAESFLSRKLLSFKGKERATSNHRESLDEPWEVVERETPSLSSVVQEMEAQPSSPPHSPIHTQTPPVTPPRASHPAAVVDNPPPAAPSPGRSSADIHPLSLRDRKVPLMPVHVSRPHRQRHATRPEPRNEPEAPMGPFITTVRTRRNAESPPSQQPQEHPTSHPTASSEVHSIPVFPQPSVPAPAPESLPSYVCTRAGDKTPPRTPRSPLYQCISVPEPPMTPLFLTPPATPIRSSSEDGVVHGPTESTHHILAGSANTSSDPSPSAQAQGMSPNQSAGLFELASLSVPSTPRHHYLGRPLPRPPGTPQRVVDSIYASGEVDSGSPLSSRCPEGLLIDFDEETPTSASVTPTGSLLVPPATKAQPLLSVPVATTPSTSSLEEMAESPIEGTLTPPRNPPSHLAENGHLLEVTDLDMLINRLDEQTEPSNGSDYDTLITLAEFLGPATLERAASARQEGTMIPSTRKEKAPTNENIALGGKVELGRRRTNKEGRVKIKLLLNSTSVDRCGICLSQFKEAETARLASLCRHAFHDRCLSRWLAHNQTCPMCRVALYDH